MTTSRLERPAEDVAYLVAEDGTRWRVHDCCFGRPLAPPGYRMRLRLEAPSSNTRYFVSATGDQRAYIFKRSESHRLTVDECARQFAESGYCWKGPHNPPPAHPTG